MLSLLLKPKTHPMKKLILPFVAISLLFTISCDDDDNRVRITGSGNIITESRTVDSYSQIEIRSVIDATIAFGSTPGLSVSADDNIIDLVSTEVAGNKLIISLPEGDYEDISVNVSLVNPNLRTLTSSGVNNITVSGFENLDQLDVIMTGVGNIEMSGSSDVLNINSSGSMNFSGFEFVTNTCDINLSGVGNIEITVNELLTGSLTGVGNILYRGSPQVNISVTGVGNVINSN